jgi:hypothetical protein
VAEISIATDLVGETVTVIDRISGGGYAQVVTGRVRAAYIQEGSLVLWIEIAADSKGYARPGLTRDHQPGDCVLIYCNNGDDIPSVIRIHKAGT